MRLGPWLWWTLGESYPSLAHLCLLVIALDITAALNGIELGSSTIGPISERRTEFLMRHALGILNLLVAAYLCRKDSALALFVMYSLPSWTNVSFRILAVLLRSMTWLFSRYCGGSNLSQFFEEFLPSVLLALSDHIPHCHTFQLPWWPRQALPCSGIWIWSLEKTHVWPLVMLSPLIYRFNK